MNIRTARKVGFFSSMFTVMKKELLDFSRDRKTLALTLLMGPLIYPVIMLGMGKLMEMRTQTQLEKPLEIAIVGHERAPNLTAFLASQGVVAQGTPDELRAATGESNLEDAFVKLIGSEEGLHA